MFHRSGKTQPISVESGRVPMSRVIFVIPTSNPLLVPRHGGSVALMVSPSLPGGVGQEWWTGGDCLVGDALVFLKKLFLVTDNRWWWLVGC